MQQRVTAKPAAVAGSRERGDSPWLGRSATPSATLLNYQQLERPLGALWPPLGPDIAPATALGALIDWSMHLALSPAKQWELAHYAAEQGSRWFRAALAFDDADAWVVDPLPQDKLRRSAVAAAPVRLARAGVPAAPGVVAARDDRRAGRQPAPRGDGRVRGTTVARHGGAVELGARQPARAAADAARAQRQPDARRRDRARRRLARRARLGSRSTASAACSRCAAPTGVPVEIKVPDKQALDQIQLDDQVVIGYRQAAAVSIEPGAAGGAAGQGDPTAAPPGR